MLLFSGGKMSDKLEQQIEEAEGSMAPAPMGRREAIRKAMVGVAALYAGPLLSSCGDGRRILDAPIDAPVNAIEDPAGKISVESEVYGAELAFPSHVQFFLGERTDTQMRLRFVNNALDEMFTESSVKLTDSQRIAGAPYIWATGYRVHVEDANITRHKIERMEWLLLSYVPEGLRNARSVPTRDLPAPMPMHVGLNKDYNDMIFRETEVLNLFRRAVWSITPLLKRGGNEITDYHIQFIYGTPPPTRQRVREFVYGYVPGGLQYIQPIQTPHRPY